MRVVTDSIQVGDKVYEASQTLCENGGGDVPSGTIDINNNGKHDVYNYAEANVNVPSFEPSGELEISNNGVYNVREYETAKVNVSTTIEGDRLQYKCNNLKRLSYELYECFNANYIVNILTGLDTSEVEYWDHFLDFANGTPVSFTLPYLNTDSALDCKYMFDGQTYMRVDFSNWEFPSLTNGSFMLSRCETITETPKINCLNAIELNYILQGCRALIHVYLYNIRKSFTISSGSSSVFNVNDESLYRTAYEMWDLTGLSTQSFSLNPLGINRIRAMYVKLIDITDEMRANDEYVDNKKPFEICESADEGAMTLEEYIISKNWTIKSWN